MLRYILFTFFCVAQSFATDWADHNCQIFLTGAHWLPQPGEFYISIQTPNREQFGGPNEVKLLIRFHRGDWRELTPRAERVDDKFRYYGATFRPNGGGHPSMWLDAIAFFKFHEGRLFDHNWHFGNWGYLTLNRSNNWSVSNLSPHCRN